jgi:hypothetical protein
LEAGVLWEGVDPGLFLVFGNLLREKERMDGFLKEEEEGMLLVDDVEEDGERFVQSFSGFLLLLFLLLLLLLILIFSASIVFDRFCCCYQTLYRWCEEEANNENTASDIYLIICIDEREILQLEENGDV